MRIALLLGALALSMGPTIAGATPATRRAMPAAMKHWVQVRGGQAIPNRGVTLRKTGRGKIDVLDAHGDVVGQLGCVCKGSCRATLAGPRLECKGPSAAVVGRLRKTGDEAKDGSVGGGAKTPAPIDDKKKGGGTEPHPKSTPNPLADPERAPSKGGGPTAPIDQEDPSKATEGVPARRGGPPAPIDPAGEPAHP